MVLPNAETDLFWIGPLVVVIFTLILWRLLQQVTTRISFQVLENCDAECLKESVKNNWTNMAVTSALCLTLVVAMLQVSPVESVHWEIEMSTRTHLQQTYITLCVGATLCTLVSVFYCIIYLSYVDVLNQTDVMKYLLTYPDSLGDPVVWLFEGCVLLWFAISIWVFCAFGMVALVTTMGFATLFFWSVMFQAYTRGNFHPQGMDFSWTQEDPSKWPTTFVTRHMKRSKITMEQVKVLGKYLIDKEKEKTQAVADS